MPDVICKQLEIRGLMTGNEHQRIRSMLNWDTVNPFASLMAAFYLVKGPELVVKMLAANADWAEVAQRHQPVLQLLGQNQMAEASVAYGGMLCEYMAKYWPDCKDIFWKKSVLRYQEAKERLARGETIEGVWPATADGPPPAFPYRAKPG